MELEDLYRSPFEVIDRVRQAHYVSCWRAGAGESMAMWDIYGKGDGAVAIKSDVRRLKLVFASCAYRVFLARVDYVSWEEITSGLDNAFVRCFRKDDSYSHEAEVRAVISALNEDTRFNLIRPGIEVEFDPSNLVTQVVVGPRQQEETVELVESLLDCYGLNIPVIASNRLKRRD